MNKTKIQYALIAHQQLSEAQERASLWSSQLNQRLENLDQSEAEEYSKRTGLLINHLARNCPSPHG
ncbi:MAG: hypothetical protein O2909_04785 [Chloroflexi bacterium]|nr:hypothetical protein [Chloroflexota bacterium]MDA1218740.1 hypothetical protein [Chloroflexota bacterium]PKB58037.1 MAG: hypothetical protein BZY73_00115 [SAR202 cluster bacterium Casp-Chloro-G3]